MHGGLCCGPEDFKMEHQLPYVVYQVLNEPNVIRYAWATGMGDQVRWKNDRLPVRLTPAK